MAFVFRHLGGQGEGESRKEDNGGEVRQRLRKCSFPPKIFFWYSSIAD